MGVQLPITGQVQTPMDPVQAAIQSQQQLQEAAAAQLEAQRQRAAQVQARNNSILSSGLGAYGGIKAMDYIAGSVAPAMTQSAPLAASSLSSVEPGMVGVQSAINGGVTMVPQGATAASQAAAPQATTTAGGSLLGPALGAYGMYDLTKKFGQGRRSLKSAAASTAEGAAAGAALGAPFEGVGAVPGAIIGGVYGLASSLFQKSGKDKDQLARDQVRKALVKAGVLDNQYQIKLADGSTFNFGMDGHAKLQNVDGSWRPYYNTDRKNPLAENAIPYADKISTLIVGDNSKLRSDFTAYLVNAATQNAKDPAQVQKNLDAMYSQVQSALSGQGGTSATASGVSQMNAIASQEKSFNSALAASISSANSQAAAAAKAARKQDVLQMASQPVSTPQIQSSPIKTGVASLDSILGGVLG